MEMLGLATKRQGKTSDLGTCNSIMTISHLFISSDIFRFSSPSSPRYTRRQYIQTKFHPRAHTYTHTHTHIHTPNPTTPNPPSYSPMFPCDTEIAMTINSLGSISPLTRSSLRPRPPQLPGTVETQRQIEKKFCFLFAYHVAGSEHVCFENEKKEK